MNRLMVKGRKIELVSGDVDSVLVLDNTVNFCKNGDFELEFDGDFSSEFTIVILDGVSVKLTIMSFGNDVEGVINYKLGNNSNLLLFKFYNNKGVTLVENVYLDGRYSSISYNFSSVCLENECYKMNVFHNNCYVTSNINNRCVGVDGSKVSFVIDSVLDTGNVGCKMNQDTKIICMGDVDASISPNMYIEDDDVEARHGSVIGKFSDDNLFYLMSRGIKREEAVRLLVKGFILSNLVLSLDSQARVMVVINNNFDC